jgi:hypothetical protein
MGEIQGSAGERNYGGIGRVIQQLLDYFFSHQSRGAHYQGLFIVGFHNFCQTPKIGVWNTPC